MVGLRHVRRVRIELQVDPDVGVRHEPMQRWIAELRGERVRSDTMTIGTNVGHLSRGGNYRHWSFPSERQVGREARSLALLGRDDEADRDMRAAVEALGDADHGYARELRAYAGRFLARPRPTALG